MKVIEEAYNKAVELLELEKKIKFCLRFNICPECASDIRTKLLPVSEDNVTAKEHCFVCDKCAFKMSMKAVNSLRNE